MYIQDIEAIGLAVTNLSPGALRVVTGILGLPSEQHLIESLNVLTPDTLFELRQQLRKMGV
jgi:hypothetical protein